MILSDKTGNRWDEAPFVVRITFDASRPKSLRGVEALILKTGLDLDEHVSGFKVCFTENHINGKIFQGVPILSLPATLSHVRDGDILAVSPRSGELRVLYRRISRHNSLMVTPACNSFCVMCSQPPEKADDVPFRLVWEAIPLIDIDTAELVLSGGEPTLLGRQLVELISRLKCFLPSTAVHILTNGRRLKYLSFTQDIAAVEHADLMLGIPLYSDVSHEHDFIVQTRGAFDETVRGILNAAQCGILVELRVVLRN